MARPVAFHFCALFCIRFSLLCPFLSLQLLRLPLSTPFRVLYSYAQVLTRPPLTRVPSPSLSLSCFCPLRPFARVCVWLSFGSLKMGVQLHLPIFLPLLLATTCPTKYVVNKSITSFALLVFQLWFGFSGVLGGNQWEILGAYGLGFLLCAFAASRLFGNLPTIFLYDVIMFVGVVFCQFACSIVLPWLLKEHKWRLYRKVGTDMHLRSMYWRYLVLLCLLKSLLLLAIINGTSSGLNIQDKTGTIALDVMHWVTTLAFVVLGGLSFRFEWRAPLFIALFLGLYAPAYVIYWFYEIISTKQADSDVYVKRALAISFLTTGTLTLIIQPIAMLLLALQYRLFDTGFTTIFDEQYTTIASTITPSQTLYVPPPGIEFLYVFVLHHDMFATDEAREKPFKRH